MPEQQREAAREALRASAAWALPQELGHALALYPDCPAAWLYEDFTSEHRADPEIGIAYLKRLIAAIYDPRGRSSSQVGLLPLARMIAHGKLHFREGMTIVDLLPRYPTELSTTDQLQVEQWARASSVAFLAMEDTTIADEWVRYFWRHSYEISACERPPTSPPAAEEQSEHEEEGLEGESRDEPTPPASLGDLRSAFLTAVDELGQGLRGLQQRAPIDTHESIPDEVKLGLASRQFRLLRHFVADPSLWTNQMAPHFVRSMIDVRIVVAWLMKQQTDEPFERL